MLEGVIRNVRSRRYRQLTADVPIEQTVYAASGAFEVGIPWPWYETDDMGALPQPGLELLLAAPRTDGRLAMIEFSADSDSFELDDKMVSRHSREFTKQFPGASSRAPRRLVIGGLPAVELIAAAGIEEHRLLLLPDEAKTYRVRCVFPAATAPGYAVHLDSILASWVWA